MERTLERIKYHYEIEKELASKLKNANKADRPSLYGEVYDELFRKVEDHPQLEFKKNLEARNLELKWQLKLIRKISNNRGNFLEIGAGDCALSKLLSSYMDKVYAYDVSIEVAKGSDEPENFELIVGDGIDFPLADGSIDFAYSNQLMEHLHQDDAEDQLKNVVRVLKPGGKYFCITPNRINGPHDVSQYFDKVATGFHLREYTNRELGILFKKIGFNRVDIVIPFGGIVFKVSHKSYLWIEFILKNTLKVLPIKRNVLVSRLLGVYMLGIK